MKVGTICYATDQGLGILAKSFFDNGIVTDALVVRHGRHTTHDEWYPGAEQLTNVKYHEAMTTAARFCRGMDVMLFFETPFVWEMMPYCKEKGVKTVLMPMHECLHEAVNRCPPDLWLCPSLLDLDVAKEHVQRLGGIAAFLPVPVQVPWRQRTKAEVFVHNAGHGGLRGRNGTAELLEAMPLVKSPIKLILRSQDSRTLVGSLQQIEGDERIELRVNNYAYETLWQEGDAFVFPEKFNGLSLPLQEARAAGMLVMATDRYPMNTWLPHEPLLPICGGNRTRIGPPYHEFDEAIIDPRAIAAKIDEWYGRDITGESLAGRLWAEANSWEVLKPKYLNVLEEVVDA